MRKWRAVAGVANERPHVTSITEAMPLKPLCLLAELTHRCPLGCPYCSNPLALESRNDELDAATWARVFNEAAALGVEQVHLSGGEPGARRDLVDIAAHAREAGLYTNLMTAGVGITTRTMRDLWEAGLDQVQVSIQDADAVSADYIAGYRGAFQRKRALAVEAVRLSLPLTVNLVVHRANIGRIAAMVDLALRLKASRIEIAPVQYYGWALMNRSALIPTAEQVARAVAEVDELRRRHQSRIVIDAAAPDYHARLPKPGVGGCSWYSLNVTPSGRVLPCHAAESIPGLEFWNVRDRSLQDIWENSPGFNTFRSTDFLPAPGASCEVRDIDFGGCRCQAYLLTDDARTIDPLRHARPQEARSSDLAAVQEDIPYTFRHM
jgi:pyrroloquinoline quinone biosynthesis protein E